MGAVVVQAANSRFASSWVRKAMVVVMGDKLDSMFFCPLS
jgi:hypothetical protein